MDEETTSTILPCEPRTGGPAWRAAETQGHDMSLIIAALRMPVAERLRQHDLALSALLSLREGFAQQYGRTGNADRAAH